MQEINLINNFYGLDHEELEYLSENLRRKIPTEVLREETIKEIWMRKQPQNRINFHHGESFRQYVIFYVDTFARMSEISQYINAAGRP